MPDFTRDAAGNMTDDGNRIYVYDDVDRLVRVEDRNGNLIVSYTYVHVGTPAELQSRTDASGVTETYVHSTTSSSREFAIYHGDERRELYIFVPSDFNPDFPEILLVFERKEADGSTGVYVVDQDSRGNVVAVASVDDQGNETLVQKYEYTLSGELTVRDAADRIVTAPPISRLLFRSALRDPGTGFYFMHSRFYHPLLHEFISADPFVKYMGLNQHPWYLPPDPVEFSRIQEEERQREAALAVRNAREARRDRKILLEQRNRTFATRGLWFIYGGGKAVLVMAAETAGMGLDAAGVRNWNGRRFSHIGQAFDQGATWGDVGEAMVVGVVNTPGRWIDTVWEGDMEGTGMASVEFVLILEGGASMFRAARPNRGPALGEPTPFTHGSRSAYIAEWEAMIRAEKLARRPHLTQNPVRIVMNRSDGFSPDIWNTAAYVGGNPVLGHRTILRTSPGRHQPLLHPWDLDRPFGGGSLGSFLKDNVPGLPEWMRQRSAVRTVGDVDDILRAIWRLEHETAGTGLHAGHRADLAINLLQTNFENRMGLMLVEGYARGNVTLTDVIKNLFVRQWGEANSSMGGGLSASVASGLRRYYGINLPEGTPIRLVGVERVRPRRRGSRK